MRIMLIESDWNFEAKAVAYLESRADMVVRQSPATAVRHAQAWQPDVVILAAEYAGEELLNGLRALPSRPAILITEHMSRFDRAWRAWQLGGDELLMKPLFHTRELHDAIVIAMERAALSAGLAPAASLAASA
ncbi:MAG: response regulator transcription factor [Phycisphaerae bacterium]|nr:response regulator transcription factor [Phycisphaerae bacterium]